jgi:hypothetical protein
MDEKFFSEATPPPSEAPSPFLPGTHIQFAWDSTSLGALKQCPRYYEYTMIQGWSSKEESVHLRFGIEYHQALNDYEQCRQAGEDHDDALHSTIRVLLERCDGWRPDHKTKNLPNLVRSVIWYCDHFQNDPATTVLQSDGRLALELSFQFELDWGPQQGFYMADNLPDKAADHLTQQPFLLCGHLDRVVEFGGELYVMDRKTTSTTPGEFYFNQFNPNNQMSIYSLAAQVVVGSPVKGIIIDTAQIGVGFSRFTRGFTYRTKEQLEEWLFDLRNWLHAAEMMATAEHWPMNDTACDKFGGCRFREVCSKSPAVRENFLNSNFYKGEKWNPLIVR